MNAAQDAVTAATAAAEIAAAGAEKAAAVLEQKTAEARLKVTEGAEQVATSFLTMAKDTLNRLTRSKDDSNTEQEKKELLDTVRKGQKGWQKVRGNLTNIRNMSDKKKLEGVVNEVKGVVKR